MEKLFKQDRQDGDALAHAGLEVHAGETDGGVAPQVDAELVGLGQLGAHGKPEAHAELGGLAPADIGHRFGRHPERRNLVARAAGVVGDDGVLAIDRVHQFPDDAVGAERGLVGVQQRAPLFHPLLADFGDLGHHGGGVAVGLDGLAQFADQCGQRQFGVAYEADRTDDVLVEVVRVERGVDVGLALGELDAEIGLGERTADADDDVGVLHEVMHRLRQGVAAGPKRERDGSPGRSFCRRGWW